MSETALPKDDVQPVLDAPVEAPVENGPPAAVQRRGNGLAIVALLLGAAGVAVGGWGVWQVRHLQANTQQQLSQVQALNDQAQDLKLNEQRLTARLEQMPAADVLDARSRLVTQLQGDQQRLNQRLETVLAPAARIGVWPRPSICCVWPACVFPRCRTSAVPRLWYRAPMKFCANRTIRVPLPLASKWPKRWWHCVAPNSRIAPVCSCDWGAARSGDQPHRAGTRV